MSTNSERETEAIALGNAIDHIYNLIDDSIVQIQPDQPIIVSAEFYQKIDSEARRRGTSWMDEYYRLFQPSIAAYCKAIGLVD